VLLKGTGFPGLGNNTGEVTSPLPQGVGDLVGELRLQSDFAIARDPRTACEWQANVNNQKRMATNFQAAMKKLAIIGHNRNSLVDCSEVIPETVSTPVKAAT
jgi:cytochrome c peroxidase